LAESPESSSQVKPTIKELILKIIGDFPKGATTGEIIDSVTAETDIAVSTIRQALRELELDKKIITFRGPPPEKGGRPHNIYKLLEYESAPNETIIRDVVEEQREIEDQHLLYDLVRESSGSYPSPGKAMKIYGEAAKRLLEKDPIELYCDFAEWLEKEFHNQLTRWTKIKDSRDEREKCKNMLDRISEINELVFHGTLGVPVEVKDDNGKTIGPGPVALVLGNNMLPKYPGRLVDRKVLTRYLKQSVFGQRVLERIDTREIPKPLRLGGSDSSAQPIDLSLVLPWETEGRTLSVVTSVGVRYDVYEKTGVPEYSPDPKVLAQYERKKAIEEGLLIPPEAAQSQELGRGMNTRIREAALDLRQYVKDHEILFEREPAVRIHFRDGRVFPLEHRFSDAIDWGLHGELVRSSLRKFRTILNNVTASEGTTLFCGFVKRTVLNIVSYLIHWYIGFGSALDGKSIDPEMKLEDLFRGGTDSSILAYIFSALNQTDPGIYATFRIVRRFQSLQESYISETSPSTDVSLWRKRLDNHSSFMSVRGVPPDALDVYASLLARASVLMFYMSIAAYNPQYERHISIPRIEMLIPYNVIEDYSVDSDHPSHQEPLVQREILWIKELLSALFHEKGGILEKYEADLFPFRANSPKIFLVPKPVNDAHVAATGIAKVYAQDFEALLVREAKRYWHDMTRASGASPSLFFK